MRLLRVGAALAPGETVLIPAGIKRPRLAVEQAMTFLEVFPYRGYD